MRSKPRFAWIAATLVLATGLALAQASAPDIEDLVRTAEARAAQTRAALTGVEPEDSLARSLRYQDEAQALSAGNRGRLQAGMGFLAQDFRIDPYADPDADIGPGVVYVAISLSMPQSSLRQLARDAHAAGATLVIRGLVDNSFIKTQRLLKQVFVEGEEAGLVIDPRVFQQFRVNEVPAVIAAPKEVQSCEDGFDCVRPDVPYDVVRGNISLRQALSLLAQKGEAAPAASRRALSKLED